MLISATEVTRATKDKEQQLPMIEKMEALPKELVCEKLLGDIPKKPAWNPVMAPIEPAAKV